MDDNFLTVVERMAMELERSSLFFGHGTDNAFDEAAWLVAHAAGVDLASDDDLPWDDPISDSALAAAERLLTERLATRKPLAYLLHEAWFAGERFFVDERVIVPRSHLGSWIVEQFAPFVDVSAVADILDLCTGSGCIAVALARHFPSARVVASDLSAAALEVSAKNVASKGFEDRVSLATGDLFAASDPQTFDLIVSNPPYVADEIMQDLPDEYHFEPSMAFAGGPGGLDVVVRILKESAARLNDGGVLVVEAGSAGKELIDHFPDAPFTWLAVDDGEDDVVFLITRDDLLRYFQTNFKA
ncbi:MAG: 50S ribosomal protein L3 glutamine methyltransferase [marine bacterium B5-7]|nr:MAG: 50S ribosomal protein L3 glutamine methyltransferase [marine bacterium B5-7]